MQLRFVRPFVGRTLYKSGVIFGGSGQLCSTYKFEFFVELCKHTAMANVVVLNARMTMLSSQRRVGNETTALRQLP